MNRLVILFAVRTVADLMYPSSLLRDLQLPKFPLTPGRIIVDPYHITNPDVLLVGSSGAVDFS